YRNISLLACVAMFSLSTAEAGPWVDPGDMALRHDIQLLADEGIITAPVTSWPLSWGDIINDIAEFTEVSQLSEGTLGALTRVRRLGTMATRTRELSFGVDAKYDTEPLLLRGFEDRAREDSDVTAGVAWMGDRFAARINVNAVSSPDDDQDVRMDGSFVGVAIGNYMVSAGVMERWWGPGYDGSIILGNNHRPIPAISIERNDTAPFRNKWLSWLGPWDASFVWGQLENDRAVPNARFLGLRVNFRPLQSLEIGLSRTAQWCGNGDRPCDLDALVNLTIGRDNRGDGVDISNEPGNQLAGVDFRWRPPSDFVSTALYGQFIGEDEAGGFPSRYLGLLGVEVSGRLRGASIRGFAEFAGTTCQFYESSTRPNCGYNNRVYPTGYRYRGRSIGHSADNDAEVVSIGAIAVTQTGDTFLAVIRSADLNQEGEPDPANTITPTPASFQSIELSWRTSVGSGELEVGAGVSRFEDSLTGQSNDDARIFVGWRIPY
ncbi:MAG: capsule assembly Wzi family protein, partial [Pseudomonadota bacterium]